MYCSSCARRFSGHDGESRLETMTWYLAKSGWKLEKSPSDGGAVSTVTLKMPVSSSSFFRMGVVSFQLWYGPPLWPSSKSTWMGTVAAEQGNAQTMKMKTTTRKCRMIDSLKRGLVDPMERIPRHAHSAHRDLRVLRFTNAKVRGCAVSNRPGWDGAFTCELHRCNSRQELKHLIGGCLGGSHHVACCSVSWGRFGR